VSKTREEQNKQRPTPDQTNNQTQHQPTNLPHGVAFTPEVEWAVAVDRAGAASVGPRMYDVFITPTKARSSVESIILAASGTCFGGHLEEEPELI
jgi:hypothetical protein